MGKLIINKAFDALMEDMETLSRLSDGVIEDILNAEADIVVAAQRKEIQQQWSGPYSTGISAKSVKKGKVQTTKDGRVIYINPRGKRNRRSGSVRNAEIAFLNEYGSSGKGRDKSHKKRTDPKKILPRPAIRDANEKAAGPAVAAGEKIFHAYLDMLKL